jgi:hypothetical protein
MPEKIKMTQIIYYKYLLSDLPASTGIFKKAFLGRIFTAISAIKSEKHSSTFVSKLSFLFKAILAWGGSYLRINLLQIIGMYWLTGFYASIVGWESMLRTRSRTILMRSRTIFMRSRTILMRSRTIFIRSRTIRMRLRTIFMCSRTIRMRLRTIFMRSRTIRTRLRTIRMRSRTIFMRSRIIGMRLRIIYAQPGMSCKHSGESHTIYGKKHCGIWELGSNTQTFPAHPCMAGLPAGMLWPHAAMINTIKIMNPEHKFSIFN